ncbi:MAG TPA: D-aminoacylase [Microthrixaceae bacterium]|nr:D-aminoacylase [Microthrixaceae bacterium]
MAHDLVIRGGTVVDGTGAAPRRADVAVDGDRIVEVDPDVVGRGRREIDAEGLVVTPGFVDIHTHYDAQIGWDPLASSSCHHGVTSIVMGNCGMTFAPCKPSDREYLAECMESVEDIPTRSIVDGLPWDWETYGEYLASLDRLPKALNVGGMVGHGALRWWAMGERSLEQGVSPTVDEMAEMERLLAEGIDAGALGFSTSRTLRHRVPDGRFVPGTWAETPELLALASVLGRAGRGVVETAPRFDGEGPSSPRAHSEIAWMREVSIATGRPVTFNLTHTYENPEHHRLAVELVKAANADGATIRPQTTSRGIGVLFTLAASTPFGRHESWRRLADHDLTGRLAALRDPARRSELIAEADRGPGAEELGRCYVTDGTEGCRFDCAASLPDAAAAAGKTIGEFYVDLLDRTDGRGLVYWPILNQSLDAVAEMLTDDVVVLGLADGGAHVGQILDASQPTWLLTYWVREQGLLSLERGVRRLTSDGASLFGLTDRGVVQEGAFADLNIIDWEALALPLPDFVHDFPHGAGRYVQGASGYVATIVGGRLTFEAGEHTGELAGTVLRH